MTIEDDFTRIEGLKIPARRAAYSDRTAWIMATLAELAYKKFEQEEEHQILSLAGDLAALTKQDEIVKKLKALQKSFRSDEYTDNQILKDTLKVGGFELAGKGILYDRGTDTQGFVAVKHDATGPGMAVICFRGTKQIKDWLTNIDATQVDVKSTEEESNAILGKIHKGFHNAYKSIEDQIELNLKDHEDLPLYITGHSLGGALAVVATWYQSSENLAACYTFGAPRVGDIGLMDRFKTPIYRIVNGPDPVPFAPPSREVVDFIKSLIKLVGTVIPLVNRAAAFFDRYNGYLHYGFMRYLSVVPEGPAGDYPNLKVEYSLSSLGRMFRFLKLLQDGKADRIDMYHNMSRYRDKLRAHAIRRNAS